MSFKRKESESMDDEFNYIFSCAFNTIDEIRSFADMPLRIGDEPDLSSRASMESVSSSAPFIS